jgi:MOSC domain-containing protein YiiM
MGATGIIYQINASNGGVPKLPLTEATIDTGGITEDAQGDLRSHGHPHQALCLFALEIIEAFQVEGHRVYPGSTGENITTSGVDWRLMVPGAKVRLGGEVEIEISQYTPPCWKNAQWFAGGDFNRMHQSLHPGCSRVYARVLKGGRIEPGDPIEVLPTTARERALAQQIRTFRWPRDFA